MLDVFKRQRVATDIPATAVSGTELSSDTFRLLSGSPSVNPSAPSAYAVRNTAGSPCMLLIAGDSRQTTISYVPEPEISRSGISACTQDATRYYSALWTDETVSGYSPQVRAVTLPGWLTSNRRSVRTAASTAPGPYPRRFITHAVCVESTIAPRKYRTLGAGKLELQELWPEATAGSGGLVRREAAKRRPAADRRPWPPVEEPATPTPALRCGARSTRSPRHTEPRS